MLESALKLMCTNAIGEACSKVCGKENYIIRLYDGKVAFYGTKGQYKKSWYSEPVLLKEAFHWTTLRFTYKKDFVETLKKLGVEI